MLATDSYKATHHGMLPKGLTYMESYGESRGGDYPFTLFFGMQYYLKSYLVGQQVTEQKIQDAVKFYNAHFGVDNMFNEDGWRYILDKYDGNLPLKIESVKEGSIVPTKNMLYKISSTDEKCAWLVNWVETLLMKLWYPITVATNSLAGMEIVNIHAEKSGTKSGNEFKLVDFGYRGVASEEQAWLGGAANLLSFKATDTVAGIRMLMEYYDAPMCGYSIPATEHMVMTIRGRDFERETYKQILSDPKYRSGKLALVSDTYDIYAVCRMLSEDTELKELILSRNGQLIIRPDSGDPQDVLLKCLEILGDGFGYTVNEKGYKVLNPKIGLLQGDGITIYTMHEIMEYLESATNMWSFDNIAFGSGGGLLQHFNRDSLKFAIKACYAVTDGVAIDVYKDPITGSGKTSKKGQLYTVWNDKTGYETITKAEFETNNSTNMLQAVFLNGVLYNEQTYQDIIDTKNNEIKKLENLEDDK
jgi:nicotinamide phosphoribosyltransferase